MPRRRPPGLPQLRYFKDMTINRHMLRFGASPRPRGNQRLISLFRAAAIVIGSFFLGFFDAITLFPEPYIAPTVTVPHRDVKKVDNSAVQYGVCSWYNYDFNRADQKCRDSSCWSLYHSTCASRDFPRYSTLIVRRLDTGKEIECYVNDVIGDPTRIIDLSSFAFNQLAPLKIGLIDVSVRLKE